MNNRDYKQFAQGEYYHIYNRGVGKMKIFNTPEDYHVFLSRLHENLYPEKVDQSKIRKNFCRQMLPSHVFSLISYCLMPNHFHLLVKQETELSLSQLLLKVCTGYSKYFNKINDRVGSLFQDQFKAVLINSDDQLLWLSGYIHCNPQTANIISDCQNYPYSSYKSFIEGKVGLAKSSIIMDQFSSPKAYIQHVSEIESIIRSKNKVIGFDPDLLIDAEEEY